MRPYLVLLALVLPALTLSSVPRAAVAQIVTRGQEAAAPRFKSSVKLVYVPVTVTDGAGRFVRGLTAGDFSIAEDDAPQDIQVFAAGDVPLSLAVVLDTSPSMSGQRFHDAVAALRQLVRDALQPDDEVSVQVFMQGPRLLQPWTDEQTLLNAQFTVPETGGTPLYATILLAADHMAQARHVRRVIAAITDGNSTDGWDLVLRGQSPSFEPSAVHRAVVTALGTRELSFYAIGVDSPPAPGRSAAVSRPANRTELQNLSEGTGGYAEIIESTADLSEAIGRLTAELKHQYLLGYEASKPDDGTYREIAVTVKAKAADPAYTVRARRGYVAASGAGAPAVGTGGLIRR